MKSRKSKRSKMLRAAAKTTSTIRHVAASKWSKKAQQKFDTRKLGKMGAASPVRILVKDGVPVDPTDTEPGSGP